MERTRRRVWTRLITVAASLMVAAAVLSGLFQFAVLALPGYRDDLENWVSGVAGRPVRIGTLALTWRGYYPSLDLGQVELRSQDGRRALFALERVRLGLGLTRLVAGDFTPRRVELVGLNLRGRIDRDGKFHLLGVDDVAGPMTDYEDAVRQLERFSVVRLTRWTLALKDERSGETQTYGLADAQLESGLLGREFEAQLRLPESLGEALRLDATFAGALADPASWTGRYRAELKRFRGGPWLRPWLAPGASIEFTDTLLRSSGDFREGRLTRASLGLQSGPIQALRSGHGAQLRGLSIWADARRQDGGWEVDLRRLAAQGAQTAWPEIRGRLGLEFSGPQWTAVEAELSQLPLGELAPWLAILRTETWLADLHDVSGAVQGLRLRWTRDAPQPLRLRAEFKDLRLPAPGRRLGFEGLSGDIVVDETGGRLVLKDQPLRLELPDALSNAVKFEHLAAEAQWRPDDGGWNIVVPRFAWTLAGSQGQGRCELRLPPERAPELKLYADFAAADATRLKPYMPSRWSEPLQDWLNRAIVAARVPHGELKIQGPLTELKKPGVFSLDLEVADAELAFAPDWPALAGVHAKLEFRGNALAITADAGSLSGTHVETARARVADYAQPLLEIDGRVSGELPQFYEFLRASPLRARFAGLTEHSTAQGAAQVDLRLDIPLRETRKTAARGVVRLNQAELRYAGLEEPIRAIQGQIEFNPQGVSADRLSGRFYELELAGRMHPQGAANVLDVDFQFSPNAKGEGVSSLIPAWLRRTLSGRSRWSAQMLFGSGETGGLLLSSDMQGTAVELPPPLGKPAAALAPLRLRLVSSPDLPLRLALDYDLRLGADLHFGRAKTGGLALERGLLRLGAGEALAAQEPGLVVTGVVPQLDWTTWSALLSGAGLEPAAALKRVELRSNLTLIGDYALRDSSVRAEPALGGWRVVLSGAGADGELNWRRGGGKTAANTLSARLKRLALDHRGLAETPAGAPGEPLQPAQLPVLDVEVEQLSVGKTNLGRVNLATQRIQDGQSLQKLSVAGGVATLEAQGRWTRERGQSAAELNLELSSTDFGALLRAFGYAPNLDAKQGRVRAGLSWAPRTEGLSWTLAQGSMDLEFGNGQLRALEPGAGRVLGLINFYALPRRLSLNFRDVVSKGLGFDRIKGRFQLADGNAMTDKIEITAPSLRMEMRGRIGLAARDYDQYVTVYPDVSAGVTLGAALLGGPALGAIALVAQEVLNKPLDQATQLSYRLTGSWDNPKLEPARNAAGQGSP